MAKSTAENQDVGGEGERGWRGLEDEQKAERNARRVPDAVPDRSHVISHIIFECHVTHLGWQGIILLSTLLSQC
jgi:hypothetical protein